MNSDDDSFHSLSDGEENDYDNIKASERVALEEIKPLANLPNTEESSLIPVENDDNDWNDWGTDNWDVLCKKSDEKSKQFVENESIKLEIVQQSNDLERPNSLWDWTNVVNAVGEGLNQVLNTVQDGLGVPTPEELAKMTIQERLHLHEQLETVKEPWPCTDKDDCDSATISRTFSPVEGDSNSQSCDSAIHTPLVEKTCEFSKNEGFGALFSGVSKSLMTSSLDVLESLGKTTFQTLTIAEDGEKKRLIFQPKKVNLSKVLRELKSKEEVDVNNIRQEEEEKMSNYAFLFEKFQGLVHLEGLEMLSENCKKIVETEHLDYDIDETSSFSLNLVKKLYADFDDEDLISAKSESDLFDANLMEILGKMDLVYNPEKLKQMNKQIMVCFKEFDGKFTNSSKLLHQKCMENLAKFTAISMEMFHKLSQMILVTRNLSNVQPFFELRNLLVSQIGLISENYSTCFNLIADESDYSESANYLLTNLFLEANNSTNYLDESLRLLRPIFERVIFTRKLHDIPHI